ncbi:hypothetical protein RIF29_20984 [Crotalaria pallida]|uniref:Uncharacterized protein n=1 Tax=Crotalaria pallida TaxID=3830 RepID=A0AAN9F2C5_CROPI
MHCETPVNGVSSKKRRNSKATKEDATMEKFVKSLDSMVEAFVKSTADLVKCQQNCPILNAQDIWDLLNTLGVEQPFLSKAYVFLIQNIDAQKAVMGCPLEDRKDILMALMSSPSFPPITDMLFFGLEATLFRNTLSVGMAM